MIDMRMVGLALLTAATLQAEKSTLRSPEVAMESEIAAMERKSHQKCETENEKPKDGNRLFADFLYWQGSVDGIDLATERSISPTNVVRKSIKTFHGEWEPGVRLGYAHTFSCYDKWDLALTWTYYPGESSHKRIEPKNPDLNNNALRQDWSTFLGPQATTAKGHWTATLNVFDIELGRTFDLSSKIGMRPYVGVRGAWLDLHTSASYDGAWLLDDEGVIERTNSFKGRSDFSGAGLRAGFNFSFMLSKYFSICSNLGTSLLWGNFNIRETFNGGDIMTGAFVPVLEKYRQNITGLRTNLEALIGIKYESRFHDDQYVVSIMAAYEMQKWFRFNELFTVSRLIEQSPIATSASFIQNHLSNDIGFQGATLRLLFQF